ncbi:Glutamyl-Q tRNA(Asp) synthetase [Tepidimonas sediminis]|uniref:Glutamyl-Q tRNA(Asp) synthetase n=1 Tax=Tepidimonas sediminis TaxID=2588941 RepID=A0A554WND9_9BURK|nr:tRNA glutamyl-Q(34) synthetase GluQRS [Tepidimonas sediminis]TSE25096.1 Glutamyl-Q tRNA(Asp) synthetase [Tepidimonas sediminis]
MVRPDDPPAPAGPCYRGRFAPSPTGLLHAGSLVAALASWLDARAHGGRWLVRLEDVDAPRCVPGAGEAILAQLAACGLQPDEPVEWQSRRGAAYEAALQRLVARGWAYPCACTRQAIEAAWAARGVPRQRHAALPYPGTCRPERGGLRGQAPRAWRLHVGRVIADLGLPVPLAWHDRRLGAQAQDVEAAVGDFVLKRADGLWAYQLAVVVDDAAQGISDVVRGEDLADNTPRQIVLQRALGVPTPRYLHTPLVRGANGEKLSKQNGAQPLDLRDPLAALAAAAAVLGLPPPAGALHAALAGWTAAWRTRWAPGAAAGDGGRSLQSGP